jgi:hypothetical protein
MDGKDFVLLRLFGFRSKVTQFVEEDGGGYYGTGGSGCLSAAKSWETGKI